MFCKQCGKNIADGCFFCEFCGAKMDKVNALSADSVKEKTAGNKFIKFGKNILVVLAVWIVSLGIVNMLSKPYADDFESFIVSVSLAMLIIFAWNKISKRYL